MPQWHCTAPLTKLSCRLDFWSASPLNWHPCGITSNTTAYRPNRPVSLSAILHGSRWFLVQYSSNYMKVILAWVSLTFTAGIFRSELCQSNYSEVGHFGPYRIRLSSPHRWYLIGAPPQKVPLSVNEWLPLFIENTTDRVLLRYRTIQLRKAQKLWVVDKQSLGCERSIYTVLDLVNSQYG